MELESASFFVDAYRNRDDIYRMVNEDLRAKETMDMFGVNWTFPLLMQALYYAGIKWGVQHMRKRETPYNVRNILVIYNASLVVMSAWIVYEAMFFGIFYSYGHHMICWNEDRIRAMMGEPRFVEHQNRMIRMWYVYYISKYIEMLDTVFFVLQKKERNISQLHLFHHGAMPFSCTTVLMRCSLGPPIVLPALNSAVHVLMYSYYAMTAMGLHKYIFWKRHLTALQIGQFIAFIIGSAYVLLIS